MLDRRNVLTFLVTALSGSILATDVAFASGDDTIHETIKRAKELVVLSKDYKAARLADQDLSSISKLINVKTDSLLGYMLENFQGNVTFAEVQKVLDIKDGSERMEYEDFSDLASGIVPVAMIRELCFQHRLPFDPNACQNWGQFMERYSAALLGS